MNKRGREKRERLGIDEMMIIDEMKKQKIEHGNTNRRKSDGPLVSSSECVLLSLSDRPVLSSAFTGKGPEAPVHGHKHARQTSPSNTSHHESPQRIIAAGNHTLS